MSSRKTQFRIPELEKEKWCVVHEDKRERKNQQKQLSILRVQEPLIELALLRDALQGFPGQERAHNKSLKGL